MIAPLAALLSYFGKCFQSVVQRIRADWFALVIY